MSAAPPVCEHCGMRVTVRRGDNPRARSAPPRFMAWCNCALVSSADPNFRAQGFGDSEDEAVAAWSSNSSGKPAIE